MSSRAPFPSAGALAPDAPSPAAVAALVGTAAAAVAAELYGVYGPKPMDCWSELWRWGFHRQTRPVQIALAGSLAGLLGRLWWHLVIEENRG